MLLEELKPEEPLLMQIIKQQIKKLAAEKDMIILDIVSEDRDLRFEHYGLVKDISIKPAGMNPPITTLGYQPCSHIVIIDYFKMSKNGELRDRATSLMRDLVLFDENNELIKKHGRWILTGHGR